MGNLSTNFDTEETTCRCGCGYGDNPDEYAPLLIRLVQRVRDLVARPLAVTSGARCLEHNRKEGGKRESAHTKHPQRGDLVHALDLAVVSGADRWEIIVAAVLAAQVEAGSLTEAAATRAFHDLRHVLCGLGVAKGFIHIDVDSSGVLPRPATWIYR